MTNPDYTIAEPFHDCTWREEMQVDDVAWQTSCGNLFSFSADGPTENRFKFCPYCGGGLIVAPSRRSSGE